jgi:dipeptidyl aminopeptidase/acylaminoacyl peptidase
VKKILGGALIFLGLSGLALMGWRVWRGEGFINPLVGESDRVALPLERYDFDSLRNSLKVLKSENLKIESRKFEILGNIPEVESRRKLITNDQLRITNFETKKFRFMSEGKWITGMINIPMTPDSRKKRAIIMVRGYADKPGYYTGFGTWKAADEFAKQGWVTVSLDFLGFGGSDEESLEMLQARFEKVVAVLDLIETVKQLGYVDTNNIGIWSHSNGGQIVLSVLEITGGNYPTVMWAPMTNPFPQSVLDTASDLDDGGKAVIKAVAEFQKQYDSRRYAFENYYKWINAPVLIQQGTADEWCEVAWQEKVVNALRAEGKKAELVIYKGDDHNLKKNWDEAVERDVEFFNTEFLN